MTTRVGRPSRSDKPRNPISTTELLAAVADLGPNWPARFGDYEMLDVTEALNREVIAGNLHDAITLAPPGKQMLGEWTSHHDERDAEGPPRCATPQTETAMTTFSSPDPARARQDRDHRRTDQQRNDLHNNNVDQAHAQGRALDTTRTGTGPKPVTEAAAIRQWAVASGIDVPTRGRIPAAIAEQYHAN